MVDKRILRITDVMNLTGLKRSTVYLWGKQGRFPRPFKIGGSRAAAWASGEVQAWIDARTREGLASRNGEDRAAA